MRRIKQADTESGPLQRPFYSASPLVTRIHTPIMPVYEPIVKTLKQTLKQLILSPSSGGGFVL